jgi:galactokinase
MSKEESTMPERSLDDPRAQAGYVPVDPDLIGAVRRRAIMLWRKPPDVIVAAPGRIEIVGNHVDYNGGDVIAAAIDRWIVVAGRRRDDGLLGVFAADVAASAVIVPVEEARLFDERERGVHNGHAVQIAHAQAAVAAVIEAGVPCRGADLYYRGTIPQGAGLSSSSALLTTLVAVLVELAGETRTRLEIARIAQQAEHRVGAPVGLLDQTAAVVGGYLRFSNDPDRVVPLDASPLDAVFAVCDSGVRHGLPGSRYPVRVQECQEAVRLLRDDGYEIEHLADVSLAELAAASALLPPPLDLRLRHVVEEVDRVRQAEDAIVAGDLVRLGGLMNASGESSAHVYDISHPAVEAVVARARSVDGVYGARMMGGGDGGSALILVRRDALDALRTRIPDYQITVCRIARGLSIM